MSVATQIPEREYLQSSYEPDCDFEDGVRIDIPGTSIEVPLVLDED